MTKYAELSEADGGQLPGGVRSLGKRPARADFSSAPRDSVAHAPYPSQAAARNFVEENMGWGK